MKIRPMILGVVVAALALFAVGVATGDGGAAGKARAGVVQPEWTEFDLG